MIWFGWVLWHINHCWLFNAISGSYVCIWCIWFVTNNSIKHQLFVSTQLNHRTFLFQITQLSISHFCPYSKYERVDPSIGPYQVQLLRARLGLGAMAVNRYSPFHGASRLKPHHHNILVSYLEHSLGDFTSLQKCSRCIQQPRLTGLNTAVYKLIVLDRNTWYHTIGFKLIVLDRNILCITVSYL